METFCTGWCSGKSWLAHFSPSGTFLDALLWSLQDRLENFSDMTWCNSNRVELGEHYWISLWICKCICKCKKCLNFNLHLCHQELLGGAYLIDSYAYLTLINTFMCTQSAGEKVKVPHNCFTAEKKQVQKLSINLLIISLFVSKQIYRRAQQHNAQYYKNIFYWISVHIKVCFIRFMDIFMNIVWVLKL